MSGITELRNRDLVSYGGGLGHATHALPLLNAEAHTFLKLPDLESILIENIRAILLLLQGSYSMAPQAANA